MQSGQAAVFLDRDGVLVEDRGVLVSAAEIRIPPSAPPALGDLAAAGFRLVVITNQAVVARGLISEEELRAIHAEMERRLHEAGAPKLDAIYYCPHHPEATLAEYRIVCDCRKPKAGAFHRAARELGIDLAASFMVGDRLTDVAAGAAAGCRTVFLETGRHADPPIVTNGDWDQDCRPDCVCSDLQAAAQWILGNR